MLVLWKIQKCVSLVVKQDIKGEIMLLDNKLNLTLRPMLYPKFYEMYKNAIKNTWTVDEVDLRPDIDDLSQKLNDKEIHLINRLVAFFATGDSIVAHNLVLNLYQHINSPEARMYLSRQLYEEALHVQFYLTLLDTYLPDPKERQKAFNAINDIPSIRKKADFCFKWMDSIKEIKQLNTKEQKRQFLLNMICFASCIEGLFFFAAFAYVYYLRSKGLLHGLATGTNWVFRDESAHMEFAFSVVESIRQEEPELFDEQLEKDIVSMLDEAIDCEYTFGEDVLGGGISGFSLPQLKQYLQFVVDQRLVRLGFKAKYFVNNPFPFMELQNVQELANFFERRVSAYQIGVVGEVDLEQNF